MKSLLLFVFLIEQCYATGIMDNVIFAVNCGGEAHTDSNGERMTAVGIDGKLISFRYSISKGLSENWYCL
jgi:hypothetical protein